MNSIIKSLLVNDNNLPPHLREYRIKEIIQELTLFILSKTDFFNHAAFYGGSALRILYKLDRFSEDLDFSLKKENQDFNLDKYLDILKHELEGLGLAFNTESKDKNIDTHIKSAFLKANTKELILTFFNIDESLPNNQVTKIKFEIDTNPPKYATFENKYILKPLPFEICAYDLPSLFAGKIHAILCRLWKNRIKGRDLYDYVFYISHNIEPNLNHLRARLIDSNFINENVTFNKEILKTMLINHFMTIDINSAKKDIIPFITNGDKIAIWSNDFFVKITEDYFR